MNETVIHEIPPVWDSESRVLILGSMPSPASRKAGFFYMHPQNRFWKVLPSVFGEKLTLPNNAPDKDKVIEERKCFLIQHNIALWDVLSCCDISGAADSSIRNVVPNDFTEMFEKSKICHVFCTGKTAFSLWQKFCASRYKQMFGIECQYLPSTSPANAAWTVDRLLKAYEIVIRTVTNEDIIFSLPE